MLFFMNDLKNQVFVMYIESNFPGMTIVVFWYNYL